MQIGGEEHQHGVLQDQGQSERHHDLVMLRCPDHRGHQQFVSQGGGQGHQRQHQNQRQIRIETEQRRAEIGQIQPDRQKVAMGEIDDPQHAERHRQPDRDDGVDAAEQQPVRERLREKRQQIHQATAPLRQCSLSPPTASSLTTD